ncbi:MAG: sigma-70 family RNA polymerase sigma factor [Bdellovibrionales bacterium]|nr:sigma-70 family RNA polymerase sigma factor [Bdellovibrionales bacterium]
MKKANNPSDSDNALRSLDESIAQLLVENHRRFQSFLARRVGSKEVAEDLLQQSLKKATERPPVSVEEAGVVAWFFTVLKNTLTDYYRAKASEEKKHKELELTADVLLKTKVAPVDEIEAVVCECMNGLLPTLKDNYADLIRRIDLGGESISSVAENLAITENNLTVRLHRARQALKTSLERTCGTCTEHGCLNCTCS